MNIKILGAGCTKCIKLEELARKTVAELNLDADIEKVIDLDKILKYGVFMTPGLVINERVKVSGKIPSPDQIKTWIQEENKS
jgi:small redox-active disulfide protein 2